MKQSYNDRFEPHTEVACLYCHKKFFRPDYGAQSKRVCCSADCREKRMDFLRRQRAAGVRTEPVKLVAPVKPETRPSVTCQVCGETVAKEHRNLRVTCGSSECQLVRKRQIVVKINKKRRKKEKVPKPATHVKRKYHKKICLLCGEHFKPTGSRQLWCGSCKNPAPVVHPQVKPQKKKLTWREKLSILFS